jgi:tetratricopeptide (TPR) repeat protein
MMNEIRLKYIFFFFSAILLILMLSLCRNAGISCDEVLHYNHSVSVYNYFASHGADQSALNTPISNLKYYGQSYDDIVTIIIKWFNINDVYGFRHLMSSVAGWLVIFITALFAVWLGGYKEGILVLFLFAVSPTFMGHTQNNLKDIPFALAYISGIYFTLRLLVSGKANSFRDLILLAASIAFSISIRAGGLIMLCYLFFFLIVFYAFKYFNGYKIDHVEIRTKFFWFCGISVTSWIFSILLWPFALKGPVKNVIESYNVMAHFPSTFRQIFEGKVEWSDFMPWYYLPKSMLITFPILVLTGLLLFIVFFLKKMNPEKKLLIGCLIFTILFPLVFVVYEKSNVYSSWRQFLFVYPGLVLLASIGFIRLYEFIRSGYLKWGLVIIIVLLSIHPLKFMFSNPQFYYLYYNQLVGGLKGAYSNYETDYYYQGQTEASRWLIDYIKNKKNDRPVKVMANYTIDWQFRFHPEIKTFYLRYEERSQADWDYAIVTNRYISPFQLRNKIWPPKNSIHIIYADNVPVCAILERKSKENLAGYKSLTDGENDKAINHFEKAFKIDAGDEMIFFNFAAALNKNGQYQKADSVLKKGLEVNPDFELILMYLGNIARSQNKDDEAIGYYEKVINVNRKYFEAYVGLSELLKNKDVIKARELLEKCLKMNPEYKPAIVALADTYRDSFPEIAKKYDELAKTIK